MFWVRHLRFGLSNNMHSFWMSPCSMCTTHIRGMQGSPSSVLLFQPKYRLGYPENYLFVLAKNIFSGSKYPKKEYLILKTEHCPSLLFSNFKVYVVCNGCHATLTSTFEQTQNKRVWTVCSLLAIYNKDGKTVGYEKVEWGWRVQIWGKRGFTTPLIPFLSLQRILEGGLS